VDRWWVAFLCGAANLENNEGRPNVTSQTYVQTWRLNSQADRLEALEIFRGEFDFNLALLGH
jgi:hypothetical protein